MLVATERRFATERLIDLKRTVDALNGQLREMQRVLHRGRVEPLSVRLWRNFFNRKGREKYMSAVCNRRIRPNTKVGMSHADSML